MNHWQDIVVVGLIAVAALYLAYILWCRLARRGNACCKTCQGCPSNSAKKTEQDESILTIQAPTRDGGKE